MPPCLVGEEYGAAWDCGVGTKDRVLIMVSAASLLQVRGGQGSACRLRLNGHYFY